MVSPFAPTQAAVESAVNRHIGNPGFFQRVAEQIACGLYPLLAGSLVPFGRNPNDKTVQGWPDAYLTKEDETLVAIEATTANDARTKHWKADLVKLKRRLPIGRLDGLIWVAWCDPSNPTDEGDMRKQVCRLGFAAKDVHIVFRKQLCSLLSAPYHARFWLNELQLSVVPDPFNRISDVIRRGAQSQAKRIFPTPEEFENDDVHAPRLLFEVEQVLKERGVAVVVGHGASGKTTLAYLLAYQERFKRGPSYILDLTSASDRTLVERASTALTACADTGVLFVIDNAHLDLTTADSLIEQWKVFGRGSELLVLMRQVRAKAEVWDSDPNVEDKGPTCFHLAIEPSDLQGVYRRHHRALKGLLPAQVAAGTLAKWMSLFGGDLIAFSAGILGLIERGGEPEDLGPEDARAWVRHHYLRSSANEQSALLDLAAVAEIEGLVPIEAFANEVLNTFIQQGIVWIEKRGSKNIYYFYRLAHPGLGTLLRSAAGRAEMSRKDRCRVLHDHTFACNSVALAQASCGEFAEAKALLEGPWQRTNWPLSNINIGYWSRVFKLTAELEIASAVEIAKRSREWLTKVDSREAVLKLALASTIAHLARILIFTAEWVPEIAKVLREELSSKENRSLLTEYVLLASHMGGVLSFIQYAKDEAPEVACTIVDILKTEENRPKLVRQAFATPLESISAFLGYADGKMPEVAKAVRAGLARDPDAVLKQAFAAPLDSLTSFLGYADREMPEVAKVLRADLAKRPDALLKQALAAPLDSLAAFLDYARTMMADVEKNLHNQLLMGFSQSQMVDRAVQDGPGKIVALCIHDRAYCQILPTIDVETWSRRWSKAHFHQPDWFPSFASFCYGQDSAILVGPIAAAIILTARAEDFPSPGINIRHLTFVVTAPHGCTPDQVEQFFSRCFTPDWLGTQYSSPDASVATLAGAVRSVALSEQECVRRYFFHPKLVQRLLAEQPTNHHAPRHVAEWLQLLSATRLLGHDAPICRQPMDFRAISEALRLWPPGPVDQGIQAIQAGLWAGLREWCHITQPGLIAAPDSTKAILAQFRAADAAGHPRIAALNAVMIDWLDRCKSHGWKLVADKVSLLEAVENQLRFQGASEPKTEA